jgi:hypothetical protein
MVLRLFRASQFQEIDYNPINLWNSDFNCCLLEVTGSVLVGNFFSQLRRFPLNVITQAIASLN